MKSVQIFFASFKLNVLLLVRTTTCYSAREMCCQNSSLFFSMSTQSNHSLLLARVASLNIIGD
jgi:hypothetical protein